MTWIGLSAGGAMLVAGGLSAGVGLYNGWQQGNAANQAAQTQSDAAVKAAQIQSDAQLRGSQIAAQSAAEGRNFDQGVLGTMQGNAQPYMNAGSQAVGNMNQVLGQHFDGSNFQQDPSYGWRLNQGMQALQASAAARGQLLGGNTLKGITDYAQGAASQEYGNAFNRYQQQRQQDLSGYGQIAGMGQQAASGLNFGDAILGQAGGNMTADIGRSLSTGITNSGQAQASGLAQSANANAAGDIGVANAYASGSNNAASSLNSAAGNYGNYVMGNNYVNAMHPAGANTTYGTTQANDGGASGGVQQPGGYTNAMGHYYPPNYTPYQSGFQGER